jgi:hypothetical protein
LHKTVIFAKICILTPQIIKPASAGRVNAFKF